MADPTSILDPNQFSILQPGDQRSLQDKMLELRRTLPPSLQGPQVGGQPGQTQTEQKQAGLGDQINQAMTALAQKGAQEKSAATGEKPSRKGVQQQLDEYQGLLDQVNPLKSQQTYGSGDLGKLVTGQDNGGIFGTGIQPIDVLAFALGGVLAPKGSSLYRRAGIALKVGMLPGQFRSFQEQKISEFGKQTMQGINAEIGVANAETAQMHNAQAKQQFDERNKLADAFDIAGERGKAAALRANAVNDYEKLTGDTSKAPASLMQHVEGISSGAVPAPQWFIQMTGSKTPQEAQSAARAWLETHMLNAPVIPTPSGDAIMRTPEGPQILRGTTTMQQPRTLADIQRDLQSARGGGAQTQQAPVAPGVAQPAVPGGPAEAPPVRRLVPTPGGGFMPPTPGQVAQPAQTPRAFDQNSLLSSKSPQDQWIGKFAGDLQPNTQSVLESLFQKPLDVTVRQKLVAQKAALDYSDDLLNKYNAMVKSYGGEKNFKFSDQLKQWMVTQGSRISGEGLSGALLSGISDIGRRAAQEYGKPFTSEAEDFMATYNQAQKFARGAMNDAANLATRERDMFTGMLGKPIDKPSFFRASLMSFHDEIAGEYNNSLAANQLNKMVGLEPVAKMRGQKPPPSWFQPITPNAPQAPTRPGEEY